MEDVVGEGQHTSQKMKCLGVMLYPLGLSYAAVVLSLEALGLYVSKSSEYETMQASSELEPSLKRSEGFSGLRTPAVGGDLNSAKCNGEWLPLGLAEASGQEWH